jgi:hypothetical protein
MYLSILLFLFLLPAVLAPVIITRSLVGILVRTKRHSKLPMKRFSHYLTTIFTNILDFKLASFLVLDKELKVIKRRLTLLLRLVFYTRSKDRN